MNKKIISFTHKNGFFEGVYFNSGDQTPLVIIVNGHNGFYNYGMFPFIQETLYKNKISSYSFNFSHGGVIGDKDFFEDLGKYEKNCIRLEVEDLMSVLQNEAFKAHSLTLLLAHSLGGVPAIFGAKQAIEKQIKITGLILLSTVSTLNFWPAEIIEEWKKKKVYYKKNNRTKQELPQGEEFLHEVLEHEINWNVVEAICSFQIPILIIHGGKDEAVPVEHANIMYNAIHKHNLSATMKIIQGATHTYNTMHPFLGPSPQLLEMLEVITNFVLSI